MRKQYENIAEKRKVLEEFDVEANRKLVTSRNRWKD